MIYKFIDNTETIWGQNYEFTGVQPDEFVEYITLLGDISWRYTKNVIEESARFIEGYTLDFVKKLLTWI